MTPTFAELFTGIGGMALGLERAGWEPKWFCEIDPFCQRVLGKRWPRVPIYEDVRRLPYWKLDRSIDLLAGGFPCQDISNAHTNGERFALAGSKSALWEYFRYAVAELRPPWVVVENVAAWRRWVPHTRADLAYYGYASLPLELSAGSFGAPHRRPRVFVVAHANGEGQSLVAIHEEVARLRAPTGDGGCWRSPPAGALGVADGLLGEMDRLRALGNAVVPQVAQWLGERILKQAGVSA